VLCYKQSNKNTTPHHTPTGEEKQKAEEKKTEHQHQGTAPHPAACAIPHLTCSKFTAEDTILDPNTIHNISKLEFCAGLNPISKRLP
jgi:hypothetical protein